MQPGYAMVAERCVKIYFESKNLYVGRDNVCLTGASFNEIKKLFSLLEKYLFEDIGAKIREA